MKKILLFLSLFLSVGLSAQYNYMSLNFASSNPLGDFGDATSLANHGFAKSGFAGEYTGAYFLTDYFGIGGNIKYTTNDLDRISLGDLLRDEIPDSISGNGSVGFGYWKQISFVVGPHFTLPASSSFFIDAYAFGGINFVLPPTIEITVVDGDDNFHRSLSVQSVSYALDLGVALRYNINDDYGIRFFTSYFMSKAKGEILEVLEDNLGDDLTNKEDFSTSIQTLHVGLGLVYRL